LEEGEQGSDVAVCEGIDMSSLVLAGIILLLVITGFYAWFTYQLILQFKTESQYYKQLIEQQLKLSAFPHLYCDMECNSQGNAIKLELFNVGNIPAYDIHVSAIGAYTEEILDIPSLMRSYIQPRYRKYPLQVDKVGYYGIRSSVRCPMLPSQKKLAIALTLPVRPVDVYVFVQCRELLGTNYYQLYCFSDLDENGNYHANIIEPKSLDTLERIHLYDMDDTKLNGEKSLPYPVTDFLDLWNHALSYRFTVLHADNTTQPAQNLYDT
jgi:hypothetical protein